MGICWSGDVEGGKQAVVSGAQLRPKTILLYKSLHVFWRLAIPLPSFSPPLIDIEMGVNAPGVYEVFEAVIYRINLM
ncbi:hypothetical protein Pint_20005 [Pistacia integerrima]|uniref:Uncharacterized protein n=1 Tax=Pistacia integerrima TaxID=434235 RepID=A0ACC0XBE8_9ROSI|nr:hypothetical protein Pint_20005 [Pistacia integerrima]